MRESDYFKAALSDFAFDVAYGDSIRHLYESGYTVDEIKKHFGTESLTTEKIEAVIKKYSDSKTGVFNNNSCSSSGNDGYYDFVKVYDEYGHSSYIWKKTKE